MVYFFTFVCISGISPMKNHRCLIIILFFSSHVRTLGQEKRAYGEFIKSPSLKIEKKILKAARKQFNLGNYYEANQKYSELLRIDSTNPMYNLEQAESFYNNYRQPSSIPYYERAIKYSNDTLGEAYYFLATAYHLNGQFDNAQKNYIIYLSRLNVYGTELMKDEENQLKNEIKHKIEMCDNGKLSVKSPNDKIALTSKSHSFLISPLSNVNTEFDDYDPVLSSNDSIIYFTSRNDSTTGGRIDWDDKYYEDIYVSVLGNKGWEKKFNIGTPVNTKKHEAIISISENGNTIYFYRGIKQGTFYYSNKVNDKFDLSNPSFGGWTQPKTLYDKSDINSRSWETNFFGFLVSGNELYVVSDMEGGMGGRDIFISKKQTDGSWGPLENLGAPINTAFDEDAPFITADGKTMYFSSMGHNSMGGYDVFKSERIGDKWSDPVNLGVPINTPGDDIYFVIAHQRDEAFYSSSSKATDGTKDMDIYRIDLCDDIPFTTISGLATGVSNGHILIAEKETGKEISSIEIINGKYVVKLDHGKNYKFTLLTTEIEPATAEISVPKMCKVHDIYQELAFTKAGQPFVYKNAFFDIKKEAGSGNYSEFLAKANKNSFSDYSEVSVNTIPAPDASASTAANASVASTHTTTATSEIPVTSTQTTTAISGTTVVTSTHTNTATSGTIVASTHTTTATSEIPVTSTQTTTAISGTTVGTKQTTTSASETAASTHTVSNTSGTTTTTTLTSGGTTTTTILINNILFDYDKSAIKEEFKSELDKAVDFLKNTNKKAKIEVVGHTDSKGGENYNLILSKRRAEAVASYLASKGISRGRIRALGYGETKPIVSNENPDGSDNPEGRAKNRRTEIVVIQ